jgi:hypothetical protein
MDIDIREIEIRNLRPNNGEVEGLPRNPRKISKKNLEKLKKSVQDAPEMLRLRELIVVPHGEEFVVIAGNQRLEAAKAVGMTALPCKVLPADTDPAKLREYAINDNLPFGEDDWEVLTTEWDTSELEEWGMSVPEQKEKDEDFDIYDSPIQLLPAQDYIIIICEDGFEFDAAREHFGLGYIKKNNIKGTDKIAKARALKWKDYVNSDTFKGKTL